MAKELDQLVIKIKADTKSLNASLKQLEGKIRVTGAAGGAAFGAAGGGLAASLKKVKGPAIAAAAAIAGIALPMKGILAAGSSFEDLTDSLNIVFGSAEEGAKAFDEVKRFAQTTPFQIDTAAKAFIGLKSAGIEPTVEMLQTFADTASVATAQLGTFEALITFFQRSAAGGASLVELNRINDRGIDIFSRLEGEIGKSRTELSTFGQTAEGSRIIQEGLLKVLQRDFGGAMAVKMDNLSTKTSNMSIAFKNLGDELFKSGIGQFFKDLADSMAEGAQNAADFVKSMREGPSARDLTVREIVVERQGRRGKTNVRTQVFTDDEEEQQKLLKENVAILQAEIKALEEKRNLGDSLSKNERLQNRNLEKTIKKKKEEILLNESFIKTVEEVADAGDDADEKLGNFTTDHIDNLSKMEGLLEDSKTEAEQLKEALDLVASFEGIKDDEGNLFFTPEELNKIRDSLNGVNDELEEVTTLSGHMQDAIAASANAFTKDFVDSLLDGESALDSFKNFARNIVSQIISTFLQLAVVNQILNSIFGTDPTSGPFDTFNFSTGKINKGGAGGSSASRNQPMIVGERGPEIFVPHSAGNIMNNMNSKNAMGGGTPIVIEQNINFATGVVPTVRAEVQNLLPEIAEVSKGAVLEAATRGGAFRRGLMGG